MPDASPSSSPPPATEVADPSVLAKIGFKLAVTPGPGQARLNFGPEPPGATGTVIVRDDGFVQWAAKGVLEAMQYSVPEGDHTWAASVLTKTDTVSGVIPAASMGLIGLYQDGLTAATLAALGRSLGVTPSLVMGYTDGTTWATIGSYNPLVVTGLQTILSLAMAPNTLQPTDDMVTQITDNIGVFKSIAARMPKGSWYRPGWEANGNENGGGYVWTQHGSPAYVEGFHLIVEAIRSVDPTALFDFNTNFLSTNGGKAQDGSPVSSLTPASSDYDCQSTEGYDNGYPIGPSVVPTIEAAVAAGKRWAVPEWGLSGKDDPVYMANIIAIIRGQSGDGPPALYNSYFNKAGSTLGPAVPLSTAAYTAGLG